jgi:uncharacterized protein (DUF2147 family)
MRTILLVATLLTSTLTGTAASAADVTGSWKRPNGDGVDVYSCGGKLCGKITSGSQKGFEMLHGMAKTGASTWQGSNMKHPDMPGVMTFNGTVTQSGERLEVKGCAIGQSLCDAEQWTRSK